MTPSNDLGIWDEPFCFLESLSWLPVHLLGFLPTLGRILSYFIYSAKAGLIYFMVYFSPSLESLLVPCLLLYDSD